MQGAVGLLIAVYLQIYQGISQLKKFLNRLRFDRIMVMSLWPRFFGSPCIVYRPNNYAQKCCRLWITLTIIIVHSFNWTPSKPAKPLLEVAPTTLEPHDLDFDLHYSYEFDL